MLSDFSTYLDGGGGEVIYDATASGEPPMPLDAKLTPYNEIYKNMIAAPQINGQLIDADTYIVKWQHVDGATGYVLNDGVNPPRPLGLTNEAYVNIANGGNFNFTVQAKNAESDASAPSNAIALNRKNAAEKGYPAIDPYKTPPIYEIPESPPPPAPPLELPIHLITPIIPSAGVDTYTPPIVDTYTPAGAQTVGTPNPSKTQNYERKPPIRVDAQGSETTGARKIIIKKAAQNTANGSATGALVPTASATAQPAATDDGLLFGYPQNTVLIVGGVAAGGLILWMLSGK